MSLTELFYINLNNYLNSIFTYGYFTYPKLAKQHTIYGNYSKMAYFNAVMIGVKGDLML